MTGKKILNTFIAVMALVALSANAGSAMMRMNSDDAADAEQADTAASSEKKAEALIPNPNYIDEVVWIVGDEAILRSDIEMMRMQAEQEGIKWEGDPDCRIPEQIAVQKLFLHQAALDSIDVAEADISNGIEQQINQWIQMAGSREKLEEYRKQSIAEMRNQLHDDFKNRELVQQVRKQLMEHVTVTPADVRRYFQNVPQDSLPYVPTTVEVQILTAQPRIPIEDINKVKDELREYTNRVTSGQTSFATLARLYSEDEGSARQGGEMDYVGRGMLDPAFAQVAFNLTDPKKISKIVESEFGYHIIQLIDKRGDKIKCRHILRKPRVSSEAVTEMLGKLDTLAIDIRKDVITFDDAATRLSDDKDTRNNRGLMSNITQDGYTSRFELRDLPTEVARAIEPLQVGEVSNSFTMINSRGKKVCAIVKLKSRTEGHRAVITEDFQVMKNVLLNVEREKAVRKWIQQKIKDTYVRMDDRFKGGDFEYDGWER